ncbi:MAG: hypothetical protein NTY90_04260 [Candidatus Micrarchaeota archaeon]|nr:hypothetical protein [Candidatus Micrarchaeota archaeon]
MEELRKAGARLVDEALSTEVKYGKKRTYEGFYEDAGHARAGSLIMDWLGLEGKARKHVSDFLGYSFVNPEPFSKKVLCAVKLAKKLGTDRAFDVFEKIAADSRELKAAYEKEQKRRLPGPAWNSLKQKIGLAKAKPSPARDMFSKPLQSFATNAENFLEMLKDPAAVAIRTRFFRENLPPKEEAQVLGFFEKHHRRSFG